jgi:hypothetical protein
MGANHGFDITIPVTVKNATVCAHAVDAQTAIRYSIGCQTLKG